MSFTSNHGPRGLTLAVLGAAAAHTACNSDAAPPEWVELGASVQALSAAPPEATTERRRLSRVARVARRLLEQELDSQAKLTLVFVLDGLRPDLLGEHTTPNLWRLRQEGVDFANGHAVFPTVTRVNSPSIATGYYPQRAGIVGNSIHIPELDPAAALTTGDWNVLRELDRSSGGELLFKRSPSRPRRC